MPHLLAFSLTRTLRVALLFSAALGGLAAPVDADDEPIIQVGERNLQSVLDEAPAYATVDAGWILRIVGASGTIELRKPVRLINLQARLVDGVAATSIVHIAAEHVSFEHFKLTGNHPSVPQSERASLVRIGASNFRVENGIVLNATRHGVHVEPESDQLRHGIVRNIQGQGNQRDTVSIAGRGQDGLYTWNILVENVTSFDGASGGGVEVKDGTRNVTVRNVFTRGGEYAVDIQDHGKPGQTNHDIVVDGVHGERVPMVLTTNADPLGHRNFSIRNVTGRDWVPRLEDRSRVDIRHVEQIILENVRISDNDAGDSIAVQFASGVILRNLIVENHRDRTAPAVRLVDVTDLVLDGVLVRGNDAPLPLAVHYHLTADGGGARQVRIQNVLATAQDVGIRLDRASPTVTLTHYQISQNLTRVIDTIADPSGQVSGNLN